MTKQKHKILVNFNLSWIFSFFKKSFSVLVFGFAQLGALTMNLLPDDLVSLHTHTHTSSSSSSLTLVTGLLSQSCKIKFSRLKRRLHG